MEEKNKAAKEMYENSAEGSDEYPIEPYEVELFFKVDDKLNPA